MIFFDVEEINNISEKLLNHELAHLSAQEYKKITVLKSDGKKRSLAVRALLRKVIEKNFGIKHYIIHCDENGKPVLEFCYLSLSHSGRYVACAISDKPVGIDIEERKSIKKRNKYHYFSNAEADYVNKSEDALSERFLTVWTRKEAYYKCENINVGRMADISVIGENNCYDFITEIKKEYIFSVCNKK